jgi:hypothetical protein
MWSVIRALSHSRMGRWLRYVCTDSQYGGRALEALYRRHYGDHGMFDTRSSWSGTKVAVVAMAKLPVLLTNYHVHRPTPSHGGRMTPRRRVGVVETRLTRRCRIYPDLKIDSRPAAADLAMVSNPHDDGGRGGIANEGGQCPSHVRRTDVSPLHAIHGPPH